MKKLIVGACASAAMLFGCAHNAARSNGTGGSGTSTSSTESTTPIPNQTQNPNVETPPNTVGNSTTTAPTDVKQQHETPNAWDSSTRGNQPNKEPGIGTSSSTDSTVNGTSTQSGTGNDNASGTGANGATRGANVGGGGGGR